MGNIRPAYGFPVVKGATLTRPLAVSLGALLAWRKIKARLADESNLVESDAPDPVPTAPIPKSVASTPPVVIGSTGTTNFSQI